MSFRSALTGSALAAVLATSAQAQVEAPAHSHGPGFTHAAGESQTADEAQVRAVVTAYKDAIERMDVSQTPALFWADSDIFENGGVEAPSPIIWSTISDPSSRVSRVSTSATMKRRSRSTATPPSSARPTPITSPSRTARARPSNGAAWPPVCFASAAMNGGLTSITPRHDRCVAPADPDRDRQAMTLTTAALRPHGIHAKSTFTP